jgi:hypothetical protein
MRTLTLIAGIFLTSAALHAEHWPQFRGPTGQGISTETKPAAQMEFDGKRRLENANPGSVLVVADCLG